MDLVSMEVDYRSNLLCILDDGRVYKKTPGGIVSILTDFEALGRSSHQYQSMFNKLSSATSLRGRVLTASQSHHQHPQEPCQGKLRLQRLSISSSRFLPCNREISKKKRKKENCSSKEKTLICFSSS